MILICKSTEDQFWNLMGRNFGSREISEALGEHLYDNEKTTWCLKILDDEVISFGAAIDMGKYFLFNYDYTLAEFRGLGHHTANIIAREAFLRGLGVVEVRALCTNMSLGIYLKNGYLFKSKKGRYTWVVKNLV